MPDQPPKLDYQPQPKRRKPFLNIVIAGIIGSAAMAVFAWVFVSVFKLPEMWTFAALVLSIPVMLFSLVILDRPYDRS